MQIRSVLGNPIIHADACLTMHFPLFFSPHFAQFWAQRSPDALGGMGPACYLKAFHQAEETLRGRTSVAFWTSYRPVHPSLEKEPPVPTIALNSRAIEYTLSLLFLTNYPTSTMYIFTLALLITSAAAAADLFRRWDYSPMEPNPLQKRQLVNCAESVNGDDSCAATCGIGYASCVGMDPPVCYSESNGESCCGNGGSLTLPLNSPVARVWVLTINIMNTVLCFAGAYCDPKGCCPNGVASEDCIVTIEGPTTIASTAAGSQATGSSSTKALGLVLGGLGFFFTLWMWIVRTRRGWDGKYIYTGIKLYLRWQLYGRKSLFDVWWRTAKINSLFRKK